MNLQLGWESGIILPAEKDFCKANDKIVPFNDSLNLNTITGKLRGSRSLRVLMTTHFVQLSWDFFEFPFLLRKESICSDMDMHETFEVFLVTLRCTCCHQNCWSDWKSDCLLSSLMNPEQRELSPGQLVLRAPSIPLSTASTALMV